ncbi:hypothetical protein EDB81DRAFT_870995 [Dactylonectria macrodidyma]|uniref:GPI inositol-deacylase winged helix domain-containing protein n=1 Tax=Dactylonectria macrodidyma TaxID=307937 RepID=A0A9P9EBI6_9HYPO|nr:hypothetical protein EDB81DRAFT_870995 [Dactylonectria macrodidyma]
MAAQITPETRNHDEYAIGWVCALSKEQTAATAMLDQRHADLPKPLNDPNTYTLGSIGKHNIVIACLLEGEVGTNAAATIAARMISTFPLIKLGLMVGIGGGIPPKVRLGDVVVSIPVGPYPGVVQWDFGKAEEGENFKQTGSLNNPLTSLRTAVTKLKTENELNGSKIPEYLDELKQKWPRLVPNRGSREAIFSVVWDLILSLLKFLFGWWAIDPTGRGAEQVTSTPTIDEGQRKPGDIHVHYGLIASGNQVIKDAKLRDSLDQRYGGNVLCVEMEAAGLMNNFPCIVIRGICDYADSQKNKDWQEYAAALAAAFAKELLQYVQPGDIDGERPVRDILSQVCDAVSTIREDTTHTRARLERKEDLATSKQTLFYPGIPRARKTILTLILTQCQSSLPESVKNLYDQHKTKRTRPSLDKISGFLQSVAAMYLRVLIITRLLSELFNLQTRQGTNIFTTSRFIPKIMDRFETSLSIEIHASPDDMARYLKDQKIPVLDHAYEQAIERINRQISGMKTLTIKALLWITYAKRQLTTSELQHALTTKTGKSELNHRDLPHIGNIVSICTRLVTVDEESSIIRLVHYITQEYLKQTQERWFLDPESEITVTCVTYLSFIVFKTGFCKTDHEFEERLRSNPFYDYAAHNWGHHTPKDKLPSQVISFLESRAKVEASNQALMAAEKYSSHSGCFGASEASDVLLRLGYSPDLKDTYSRTPLWYAAQNGHETVVKLLLAAGADVNAAAGYGGRTALQAAIGEGHLEVVKKLLADGADVNAAAAAGYNGRTALQAAAEGGHLEVVKKLLADGADVNAAAAANGGQTALQAAAEGGHLEVVEELLEHVHDESLTDDDLLKLIHTTEALKGLALFEALITRALKRNT